MKVFISCPFTGLCKEEEYVIKDEYRNFFDRLTSELEKLKCDYYLAIKRENWGIDHKGPEECTKSDFDAVKDSDFLIVIPGNSISKGISGGVHIELGWASALNKKMHILIEEDFQYSPVLLGLNTLSSTNYCYCNSFLDDNMLNNILDIVKKEIELKEV